VVVKILFLQSFENQNESIHQSSNPPKSGYNCGFKDMTPFLFLYVRNAFKHLLAKKAGRQMPLFKKK